MSFIFQMNELQKQTYDRLVERLKEADSMEEVRAYYREIQSLLDAVHTQATVLQLEEKEEFLRLRTKMVEASTKEEVLYYEQELHAYISKRLSIP